MGVSELALERVTRVEGEDRVPRKCGVGKLYPYTMGGLRVEA